MPYYYLCYGLNITSDIELPSLNSVTQTDISDNQANVAITTNITSQTSGHLRLEKQSVDQAFSCTVPHLGEFHVNNGRQITFIKKAGATLETIESFILSNCLALILVQRGLCVLRGSAFQVGDKVITILGPPGTAKSHICTGLIEFSEATLVSDEMVVIEPSSMHAIVGFPYTKVWEESLLHLGIRNDELMRIHAGVNKFRYNCAVVLPDISPRVGLVFIPVAKNGRSDTPNQTSIGDNISGVDRLKKLHHCQFPAQHHQPLNPLEWAKLAAEISMWDLEIGSDPIDRTMVQSLLTQMLAVAA